MIDHGCTVSYDFYFCLMEVLDERMNSLIKDVRSSIPCFAVCRFDTEQPRGDRADFGWAKIMDTAEGSIPLHLRNLSQNEKTKNWSIEISPSSKL